MYVYAHSVVESVQMERTVRVYLGCGVKISNEGHSLDFVCLWFEESERVAAQTKNIFFCFFSTNNSRKVEM